VHNAAWGVLGAFTTASSPVLVNSYLAGDYGILILVGVVIGAVLVGYMLRRRTNKPQQSVVGSEVAPAAK